jgi:hypothetical protein
MKSELSIVTPPASELPLTAVKNYCRISNTNGDTGVLPMLIQSARERAEQYCGRSFLQQTLEVYYTEIEREFYLPRPPVVSINSTQLIYLNEISNLTLNSDYYLMGQQDSYIVLTATTYNLPKGFSPNDDLSRFNLKVQYVAGYDTVWPFKTDGTTQTSKIPMGICEKAEYPALDITQLTEDRARLIYNTDYWLAAKCPEVKEELQYMHFSCAVNCGVATATKIMQRAANIKADGIIGPVTLEAAKKVSIQDYAIEWAAHYRAIIEKDATQQQFLKGWLNRIDFCLKHSTNL